MTKNSTPKRKWTTEEVRQWYRDTGAITYANPDDLNIVVKKPRSEVLTVNSNSTVDMTGGTLNVNGDLGRASGNGILIGKKIKAAEDLEQLLWFELITTDLSGKENTYQLPLILNKVA